MPKSKKAESKHRTAKVRRASSPVRAKQDDREDRETTSTTVPVDRRSGDRRTPDDRRKTNVPVPVERRKLERRVKVNRRRQIDPTTCERDYTDDEIEFMSAIDEYKRASGRMFPTCSEILEVLRKLGYVKAPRPNGQAANGQAPQIEISIVDIFRPRPANQH